MIILRIPKILIDTKESMYVSILLLLQHHCPAFSHGRDFVGKSCQQTLTLTRRGSNMIKGTCVCTVCSTLFAVNLTILSFSSFSYFSCQEERHGRHLFLERDNLKTVSTMAYQATDIDLDKEVYLPLRGNYPAELTDVGDSWDFVFAWARVQFHEVGKSIPEIFTELIQSFQDAEKQVYHVNYQAGGNGKVEVLERRPLSYNGADYDTIVGKLRHSCRNREVHKVQPKQKRNNDVAELAKLGWDDGNFVDFWEWLASNE